jgi:hypothetical protein
VDKSGVGIDHGSMAALPILFLLPALLATQRAASTEAPQATWSVEVVLETRAKLNGCAVGDFDPASRNPEIASVDSTGNIFLTRQSGPRQFPWISKSIARAGGELIGCAFGDVDPTREGLELVAYGMLRGSEDSANPGAVYLISRGEEGIEIEEIFHDTALIHGGAIGDFDTEREGLEIIVTGFSKKVHLLYLEDDMWQPQLLTDLTGAGKSVATYSNSALVACDDGNLMQVVRLGDKWRSLLFDRAESPQTRVATLAGSVLVSRDDGTLNWISDAGKRQIIFESKNKLRGAALGELDPLNEGPEAATAGYGKRLVVLYGQKRVRAWRYEVIYTDTDRFHHVLIAEVKGGNKAQEVVACGHSGRLIVAALKR